MNFKVNTLKASICLIVLLCVLLIREYRDYIIVGLLLAGSVYLGFKIFWFLRLMLWV